MVWIIASLILTIILLTIGLDIKFKDINKIKEVGYSKELKVITDKFPENEKVCKEILSRIGNETTKIEKEENTATSLYMVMPNKIIIGNIQDSCTRIQTIAHECIHSIQNKKILKFNFIYSNFYLLFFLAVCILSIFRIVDKNIMYILLTAQMLSGAIYFTVRSFIEIDAMTKAPYLAKEYMNSARCANDEEINLLQDKYTEINKIGIKLYVYILACKTIIKTLICSVIIQLV